MWVLSRFGDSVQKPARVLHLSRLFSFIWACSVTSIGSAGERTVCHPRTLFFSTTGWCSIYNRLKTADNRWQCLMSFSGTMGWNYKKKAICPKIREILSITRELWVYGPCPKKIREPYRNSVRDGNTVLNWKDDSKTYKIKCHSVSLCSVRCVSRGRIGGAFSRLERGFRFTDQFYLFPISPGWLINCQSVARYKRCETGTSRNCHCSSKPPFIL